MKQTFWHVDGAYENTCTKSLDIIKYSKNGMFLRDMVTWSVNGQNNQKAIIEDQIFGHFMTG